MIITQIENAMIARVKAVNSVPNFPALLKTVDRWSGDFGDENLDLLVTSAPFALATHTGSQVIGSSMTGSQWQGEFTVICGSTSRRTQALSSRVGGVSAGELGSRQIAELVRDLLSGQTLGLPITVFEPLAIEEIYSGQAGGSGGQHFFSATGIRFGTKYSTTRSTAADPLGTALATIVATFAATIGADQPINDPTNNTVSVTLPGAPT